MVGLTLFDDHQILSTYPSTRSRCSEISEIDKVSKSEKISEIKIADTLQYL